MTRADILRACVLCGQIKRAGEHTHSHTHSMPDGTKIDINQLIQMSRRLKVHQLAIDQLKNYDFSARSGFSRKRLAGTDTQYPLLVGSDMTLLDGRHRVKRLLDAGLDTANVRRIPDSYIPKATLPPDTTIP